MPAPEDDLKPRFHVEKKQTRVDGWVPLLAAKQVFPDWQAVEQSERPIGTTTRGANELRSVVQITIYNPASETPLDQGDSGTGQFEHEVAEWLSRRLDEALAFLNQYLVILGGMRDEWHISSLSRIDLPRDTPWTTVAALCTKPASQPTAGSRVCGSAAPSNSPRSARASRRSIAQKNGGR